MVWLVATDVRRRRDKPIKPQELTTMANAFDIGTQLVNLCKQGKSLEAVNTLYAPNIVSIEAHPMAGNPAVLEGIDAIRGKNEAWAANTEVHRAEVKGPFPNGDDRFAVYFDYEVTNKAAGQRMSMAEVGLYTVKNGKVVREEFFYPGA